MAIDRGAGFQDQTKDPNWSPDGMGNQLSGGVYSGTNAYDDSVNYDRSQANNAPATTGVQLDQGQSNQSRGLEMGALGMLRNQATGAAPSAAAITSQRANEAAANQAARAGVAGHGMGARIAGMGAAMPAVAQQATTANAANSAARAAETSAGTQAYSSGAGTMNSQDIGTATTQAGLDATQRALNNQRQQYYDQLGSDTRQTQAQNLQTAMSQQAAAQQAQRNYQDAYDAQQWNGAKTVVGTAASLATSDPRAKTNVRPMTGSLASLHQSRGR